MTCSPEQARARLLTVAAALLLPAVAGADDSVTVSVLDATPGDTLVRLELNDYTLEAAQNLAAWSKLTVAGEGLSREVGAPELPVIGRGVMIPDHAAVFTTVESVRYHDVQGVGIAPSRGAIPRTIDPGQVPYAFGPAYRSDAFYPAELLAMEAPHIMRDVRGVVVRWTPFQFNAATATLRVYDEIVFRVKESGPGFVNVIDRSTTIERPDAGFASLYEGHFVNYGGALQSPQYTPLNESGDMLIISHGPFMAAMTPFVTWKTSKGIDTNIVDVATIGNNSTAIKNHIKSVYNSSNLAYVLLVGDVAQVDSGYYASGLSDPDYSLMTGDWYPDVIVGRFSGTTTGHIQTQVERTVAYEQMDHTLAAGGWNAKGMGVASNQGPGHYGEYDDEHMNLIRTQLLGYGFTKVDQIYDYSGTVADVRNGLHNGRRMVNYCGHGSTTSWGSTGFNNNDVNALQNVGMLPFIHSVACVNGEFDYGTCFGEAWLRATHNGEPSGAVGAYMSSINQYWDEPMYAQDESVDLFTAESYWSLGALWYAGSCHMMDLMGNSGRDMFMTWIIFGDPSLAVHTICEGDPPTNYCETSPNSYSSGALMSYMGSPSIAADDFYLMASGCPPNKFCMFYYGDGQGSGIPFGNGWRCVTDAGKGIYRFPVFQIDAFGMGSMKVDFNGPPAGGGGSGAWNAGDTWNCQAWFRDPPAGGANFNLSDGLEVDICP